MALNNSSKQPKLGTSSNKTCLIQSTFIYPYPIFLGVYLRVFFRYNERSLIKERVNAGLAAAKKRGCIGGRPRAIPQEKMDVILKALGNGMSKAAACRTFEVKRSTLIDTLNRI